MKKRVISSVGVPIKFINVVMISMFLIDISSIDSNLFLFLPQKLKKQHSEWDNEIEEQERLIVSGGLHFTIDKY